MNYGQRQAKSEGFPAMKTIRPPGIRSKKQPRNPGAGSQEEEKEEAADEDEEEDDPGYGNSGDNDDDDSPPASSHRPVTRSTPKKSVSRPKRKAFRNKSGPGSSSRKRTQGR